MFLLQQIYTYIYKLLIIHLSIYIPFNNDTQDTTVSSTVPTREPDDVPKNVFIS